MPFTASKLAHCAVCSEIIVPGTVTRPLSSNGDVDDKSSSSVSGASGSKVKLTWCHADCVLADDARIPVCKHWKRKLECIYRDTCLFRHPIGYQGGSDRDIRRQGGKGRLKVFNEGRASALRRWLVSVFGEEYLRSGSGIVEVAGGKGELSFELMNLNNIPSCVFDPRPLELKR
jgi:hypothetical protein